MHLGHVSDKAMNIFNKRDVLCGRSIAKMKFWERYVLDKPKLINFGTSIHKTKGLFGEKNEMEQNEDLNPGRLGMKLES